MGRPKTTATKTTASKTTGYTVPKDEENQFHVELEVVSYNSKTGEKESKPFVQKYSQRAWLTCESRLKRQGYTHIEVLHDPTK